MSWCLDKLGEEIRVGDRVYYAAGRVYSEQISSIREQVNLNGVYRHSKNVIKTLPPGGVLFARGTTLYLGKCLRVFPHSVRVKHRQKTYLMKREAIVC